MYRTSECDRTVIGDEVRQRKGVVRPRREERQRISGRDSVTRGGMTVVEDE